MSDFYDKDLRLLAKRANAESMNQIDAFVQGFLLGRNFEREFNAQLHNSILKEMLQSSKIKFSEDNYWDNTIKELEKENFELKSKYVWVEG